MAGMQGLQLCLLCLTPVLLPAVKINAKGREIVYLAKGDSIKLGCPYELDPEDQGPNGLDIEWTQMNSDPTNLDNVILSYHGQQVILPGYHHLQRNRGSAVQDSRHLGNPSLQQNVVTGGLAGDCCSSLQQRVTFALPDPSQYDASINLQNVQVSDTATYECKVKKTTVATRKVTVTVLERPSVPQCSIVGKVATGHEVTLRCNSQSGITPLMYQWAKVTERPLGNWLPPTTIKGLNPGDLVIQNLSHNHIGVYQCSVANRVGSARCVLDISFSEGSNQVSILVGSVLGSLLFLLLLVCLIAGLVYCCRRKRCTEQSNQIRVDSAPPKARAGSRKGNLRSALGYFPHQSRFMQRRKYESPKEQECVEVHPPAQDADPGSVVRANGMESKGRNSSCPSVVATKTRVHHTPAGASYTCTKAGALMDFSAPSPVGPSVARSSSSTSDQEATQAKRGNPRDYGGFLIMMPARSREGLVI